MKYGSALVLSGFFIGQTLAANFELKADGQEPLYQTQLNKQIYQQTRSNHLQDLIVKSASGEQVPYALVAETALHPEKPQKTLKDLAVFPILETRLNQPDALKIELGQLQTTTHLSINTDQSKPNINVIYLVDLGANHPPFKTFVADWQGQQNQLIQLTMFTSNDLKSWQQSGQAVLLSTQNLSIADNSLNTADTAQQILQNNLALDAPTDARYLQIRPVNLQSEQAFTLTKLSAEQVAPSSHHQTLLWQDIQLINRNEDTKKAVVEFNFEALGHYPASNLNISLPQDNTITQVLVQTRNTVNEPWTILAHAPLYRINKNGHTTTNPDIEITPTIARFWQLQFSQSSGGIGKDNVKLSLGWQPASIIWNARGQPPFSVQVGEHPKLIGQIPLGNLLPNYKTTDLRALPVATLQNNTSVTVANTWQNPINYQRYLLWAGLVLGVCLLSGMAYSLFKSANKPN